MGGDGHPPSLVGLIGAPAVGKMPVTRRFDLPGDAAAIWSWPHPTAEDRLVVCPELVALLDVLRECDRIENRHRHRHEAPYWVTDDYLWEMNAAHCYDGGLPCRSTCRMCAVRTSISRPRSRPTASATSSLIPGAKNPTARARSGYSGSNGAVPQRWLRCARITCLVRTDYTL